MTKKHFQAIAEIIGAAKLTENPVEYIQLHLVGYFATQNQNFDGRRFNDAVDAAERKIVQTVVASRGEA